MSPNKSTHTNRQARERALELLYEAEAKGVHPADVVGAQPAPPVPYGVLLAEGVGDHRELLDHVIGSRAKGWTVARMPAVDRTLLRIATFELAFLPDQPVGVVVDEAVELARLYSTDGSPKFLNGVLAKVATDVRDDGVWAAAARPTVLVLDIDGVLRHWNPDSLAAAEESLGLPAGALGEVAFEADRLARAMSGGLAHDDWAAEIAAAIAEQHGNDPAEVQALWDAQAYTIDPDVLELVRAVREAGGRTACFSNASTRLEADLERSGVADVFDVVVNSSRLGLVKPDPAAFVAAAAAIDVEPASCLLVDDRADNVVGALGAGLPAVRFQSVERLRAVLERTGLLPPPA